MDQKIHKKPILVTGAHRSGTTWVGKMLAANEQVAYISEPLNVWHRPGVFRPDVEKWYTYIHSQNEIDFLPGFQDTLNFNYRSWSEIKALRSLKDLLRMGRDWKTFQVGKLHNKRPLLKDPFAVVSAPWFAQKLNCQIVITIRHPAGVASSLQRLNWSFDFQDLLSQEALMEDYLESFRGEMEVIIKTPNDIIAQSSLLWRMIYYIVNQYSMDHPHFQIVRHEDLSVDPFQGYQTLYRELGLKYTPAVEQVIRASSSVDNPKELSRRSVHAVQLDSRANIRNWKQRLSAEEISRIRHLTTDIAAHYYNDDDW